MDVKTHRSTQQFKPPGKHGLTRLAAVLPRPNWRFCVEANLQAASAFLRDTDSVHCTFSFVYSSCWFFCRWNKFFTPVRWNVGSVNTFILERLWHISWKGVGRLLAASERSCCFQLRVNRFSLNQMSKYLRKWSIWISFIMYLTFPQPPHFVINVSDNVNKMLNLRIFNFLMSVWFQLFITHLTFRALLCEYLDYLLSVWICLRLSGLCFHPDWLFVMIIRLSHTVDACRALGSVQRRSHVNKQRLSGRIGFQLIYGNEIFSNVCVCGWGGGVLFIGRNKSPLLVSSLTIEREL